MSYPASYPSPGEPGNNGSRPTGNPSPYGSPSPYDPHYPQSAYGNGSFAPMPPQKKSRWWLWTLIGCGAIILLIVLLIGGCTVLVATSGGSGSSGSVSSTGASDGGSDSTPDSAQPAGDQGTRSNPLPLTTGVATLRTSDGGTMDITLGEVNWDAGQVIAEANQFNDQAPEGQVYILVPVTMTYHGPEHVTPWIAAQFAYIADTGNGYDPATVVTPNEEMDIGDLYDGGTATFDQAFLIPVDVVQKGKFSVSATFSLDDEVWFAAS